MGYNNKFLKRYEVIVNDTLGCLTMDVFPLWGLHGKQWVCAHMSNEKEKFSKKAEISPYWNEVNTLKSLHTLSFSLNQKDNEVTDKENKTQIWPQVHT